MANFVMRALSGRGSWPWLASAILLCFSATVALFDLPALRKDAAQADQRIAALASQLAGPSSSASGASAALDVASRLERPELLSAVARDMKVLAVQNGIVLLDADYKPVQTVAVDTGRVDVGVRMTGAYLPLKKTIAALLGAHHSLALESLTLRRAASTDAVLEMDLRFHFYYRKRA